MEISSVLGKKVKVVVDLVEQGVPLWFVCCDTETPVSLFCGFLATGPFTS